MDMLNQMYSKHYDLYPLPMEPKDLGHQGVARRRVYVVMAHRKHAKRTHDLTNLFWSISKAMRELVQTCPADYFMTEPRDVQLEAVRVARLRRIASPKSGLA